MNVIPLKEYLEQAENKPEQDMDAISFEHVSFSYNGAENNLTDISFSLKKGETLGIISSD